MLFSGFLSLALASSVLPPPKFEAAPCAVKALEQRARCGVVRVPENRESPAGRSIALNVVILPSTTPARLPPLFDIDGGPGLSGTKNAGFMPRTGCPPAAMSS